MMPTETRVLMMTDRVGSTLHTQKLTTPQVAEVSEDHRQLMLEVCERWQGSVIKDTGDGYLASFASAGAAAAAALCLQALVESRSAACPADLQFSLRVGLHMGDVLIEADGDVRGDAPNAAARVQSVAQPGEVLLTREVRGSLKLNDFELQDAGTHRLNDLGSRKLWRVVKHTAAEAGNPFRPMADLRYPREFLGRAVIVRDVIGRVGSGLSVGVVGEKAIGKSWLLRFVCHKLRAMTADEHRAAYADLNSACCADRPDLLAHVGQQLALPQPASGWDLASFEAAVRSGFGGARRAVVLLDPFESLCRDHANFGDNMLRSLRSLADDGYATFVTASRRPPADVARQDELISTFHALLNQVSLGGLSPEEARAFVLLPRPEVRFTDDEATGILDAVRPTPLCLQVACSEGHAARLQGVPVRVGLGRARAEGRLGGCTP